ncbi:MAG: cyclic nucleotide-binding domain-containing protein [Pseudomonadota bacterium]
MFDFLAGYEIQGWAFLVHIAAMTQVIGYLIRDQLWLRLMLFVGTLFYVAYYYMHPATPLWDAIYWGGALGLANAISIVLILRDRTRFRMSVEEERLYRAFHRIGPGEFRRLMKIAQFHEAGPNDVLTHEGVVPEKLFYVMHGTVHIEKNGKHFTYMAGAFVGELSMVTDEPAIATVWLEPSSAYVSWDRSRITALTHRRPSMKLALDQLISRDMAIKVQQS